MARPSDSTTYATWCPDISLRSASVIGEYFIDSSVASIGFSSQALQESITYFEGLPDRTPEQPADLMERVGLYASVAAPEAPAGSLDAMLACLTYEHESEHHRISATTPFGLAVWRAFQALRTDLDFLFKRGSPEVFSAFAQCTSARALAFQRAMSGQSDTEFSYADQVCWECHLLKAYVSAMLNDRSITKGAFVDLANVAEIAIARRSGVATNRRITVAPSKRDEPLVPDASLTPLEIMEATATLHEEALLLSKRLSHDTVRQWREASLHGIYERAHAYFRTHFGFTRFGKIAGDLSFCGAADIATAPRAEIDLADFFPTMLLDRIRDYCADRVLPWALIQSDAPGIPLDDAIFGGRIRRSLEGLVRSELWNDNFISARSTDAGSGPAVAQFLRDEQRYSDDRQRLVRSAARSRLESFGLHANSAVSSSPFGPHAIVVDDGILFPDLSALLERGEGEASGPSNKLPPRETDSFASRLMTDYAENCAVKRAVFDMQAPELVETDPAHFPEKDARRLAATHYRSFFPERPTE